MTELTALGWIPDGSFVAAESVTLCKFAMDRPFDERGKAVTVPSSQPHNKDVPGPSAY